MKSIIFEASKPYDTPNLKHFVLNHLERIDYKTHTNKA